MRRKSGTRLTSCRKKFLRIYHVFPIIPTHFDFAANCKKHLLTLITFIKLLARSETATPQKFGKDIWASTLIWPDFGISTSLPKIPYPAFHTFST